MFNMIFSAISEWIGKLFLIGYVSQGIKFPPPLAAKDEEYYLKRYQEGDVEAKNKLIEHNLRLVVYISKKYSVNNIQNDDLISIGTIGLIKGINSFNYEKGKLSTYIARCIQNEILMSLRANKKSSYDTSLQDPIGTDKEGNSISLLDILCDNTEEIVDSLYMKMKSKKLYESVENILSNREKEIIILRYGLYDNDPKTQMEVGKLFGISRSYVSRIEKKALEILRKEFEKKYEGE